MFHSKRQKPRLPTFVLSAVTALVILALFNDTLWNHTGIAFADRPMVLVGFQIALFGLTMLIAQLLSIGRFTKIWHGFLILFASASAYYLDTLSVYMNRDMIQNVLATTFTEGKHLITLPYVTHLVLTGLVPVAILALIPVRYGPGLIGGFWRWLLGCLIAFAIFAVPTLTWFKDYSSTLRTNRQIMAAYQPGSGLAGIWNYAKMTMRAQAAQKNVQPIGADAIRAGFGGKLDKPSLIILVAGETARAQNFGLNGYERNTTPELAKRDVIYWNNVEACGTSTAISLPCMFSDLPRRKYSAEKASARENLLDVLARSQFDVQWWENNTGDKGIAKRQTKVNLHQEEDPQWCATGECTDGIFLPRLDDLIANLQKDTVLVLHQIGSHGPAYYLRSDAERSPFMPQCETSDFSKCSQQEIINAYDNTLVFTDWVLAQIIDRINNADHLTGAVVYVSDHGESLGENGIYLHGSPYFVAPDTQTRVPMLMWLKDDYAQASGVDRPCLKAKSNLSHDHLFHSMLGLADIKTEARDPQLDVFEGCRP